MDATGVYVVAWKIFLRENMKRFIQFCAVGGVGLVLNLLVAYMLTDGLGFWYFWGFLAGVFFNWTFNFLANSFITFKGHSKKNYTVKYGLYLAIYAGAFIINSGLVYLMTSVMEIYYLASIAMAAIITALITFNLSRKFVYSYEEKYSQHF